MTRPRHHRLDATTPNHYTTEAENVILRKSVSFYSFSIKHPPARWSPAALTELLTVKKQCKHIFHGNEWMKEHNYAFQNADTRPGLQSRTQNMFCYLDFRCYFEANGQNHIHFRLIQFLKNSTAWHFLTFTSHLYIPRVAESKSKCSSSSQV